VPAVRELLATGALGALPRTTLVDARPPRERAQVPVQLSRLLEAHALVLHEVREVVRQVAAAGDDGTQLCARRR
jgi:hypothetical protein